MAEPRTPHDLGLDMMRGDMATQRGIRRDLPGVAVEGL